MAFFNTNTAVDLFTFNFFTLLNSMEFEEDLLDINTVFDSTDLPGVPAPFLSAMFSSSGAAPPILILPRRLFPSSAKTSSLAQQAIRHPGT